MEEILLHNSFILFEIICVIAVFAIFIIRSNYFTEILEHRPRIFTQILFMVFYGLLSIIGTVTGIGLFGSIGNVRDIGPMMAGLTCGPVIGLGAGIIGGVYRFLQGGPYMYTGLSAPILCGILGGVLYLANNREFVPTWMATLYMALCDTLISIYTLTIVTPPEQLWTITRNIAIPMIVGSTVGVFIFSYFIHAQMAERKRDQEYKQLERQNADRKNLESIINTLADPVFLIDKQYTWRLVNDRFCQFFGKTRDSLIGRPVAEFLPAEEYEVIRDQSERVFHTGSSLETEMIVTGINGQNYTVISKNTLYVDSNCQEYIVGIIRDISMRKKMEETIKESEARLSSILQSSPLMQFVIDKNHRVLYWNKAIETFSGISASTIIGTTNHWNPFYRKERPMLADFLVDEDVENISQWYSDRVIKAPYVSGSYEGIEFMPDAESPGGWFYFTAAPVRDINGRIIGAVETFQDISETKKLESALQLTLKKLNLLSSITRHDLLNKLSILSGLWYLITEYVHDPEGTEILTRVKDTNESIQRQLAMTREYQELGIKAPVWQNLSDVFHSAVRELDSGPVVIDIPESSIEIFADALLSKVFYNLFENAIRHGEKVSHIRVLYAITDKELHITVNDDGVGIPSGEKEYIFERGYGKNTGWGLFLSKEILEITGITIREIGTPGEGAVFEIIVPKTGFRKED